MWHTALVLLTAAAAIGPDAAPFLTGSVVGADGAPVAGAQVLVLRPESESTQVEDPERAGDDLFTGGSLLSVADHFLRGETSPEGEYCIEVPEGAASFHVAVRAPDLATGHWRDVRPAGPPPTLRLGLASRLVGTVVAHGSGEPIGQATAYLARSAPPGARAQRLPVAIERMLAPGAACDVSGKWAIDRLAPGLYSLRLGAPGRRPWTEKWITLRAGETRRIDVVLPVGTTVTGTVTDPEGQPIGGAAVTLWSGESGERRESLALGGGRSWEEMKTDQQGGFSFAGLELSRRRRVAVSHPDHAMAVRDVPEGAGRVDVQLTAGASLSGLVVDGADRPVAGIHIGVLRSIKKNETGAPDERDPFRQVSREDPAHPQVTRASGEFTLDHLPAGDFEVFAWPDGSDEPGGTPVHLVEGETLTGLRLVVAEPHGPSGRVVDESRQPIARTSVMAYGEAWGFDEASTDAQGRFLLRGVRGAQCRLTASAPGFAATTIEKVAVDAIDVELVLGRAGAIAGCVKLEAGEPASAVTLGAQRAAGEGGRPLDRETPESRAERMVATEDGCYRIEDLAPGTWSVIVGAPGYLEMTLEPVRVEPGRVARAADVTLRRGSVLVGRVVSSIGRLPVAGAEIARVEGDRYMLGYARHRGTGVFARSDASGEYRLEGLPPEPTTILVSHPDFAPREVTGVRPAAAGEEMSLEIVLGQGGAIEGLVTGPAGAPEAGARVSVHGARFDTDDSQTTGPDGQYRFERLAPGSYTVEEQSRDDRDGPARSATVTVAEGETKRQDFAAAEDRRMIGRVIRSGEPVPGVQLRLLRFQGPLPFAVEGKSGPDGAFEIRGVLAGSGSLMVEQGMRTIFLPVDIPDMPVVKHDVVLGSISIAGRVIDETGEAAAHVRVRATFGAFARPEIEPALLGGGADQSDEAGRFDVPVAEAGSYTLSTFRMDEGEQRAQEVEVPEAGLRDVVIRLAPARKVAGRVVDGDGKPIRGARLIGPEVWGETDATGRFVVGAPGNGPIEVGVFATGYAPLLEQSIGAGVEEAILIVSRGGVLAVELLAAPELRQAAVVKLLDGRGSDLLPMLRAVRFSLGILEEDIAGAGRLVIDDAPAGSYELVAEASGKTARAPVTVVSGATTRVTLDLGGDAGETPAP